MTGITKKPEKPAVVQLPAMPEHHDWDVDLYCIVMKKFASLTPKRRYLLMRMLWVMFEMDDYHRAATRKR